MTRPLAPAVAVGRGVPPRLLLMLPFVVLLALALCARPAMAMDNPRVEDDAGFFSADAVSKANDVIKQIKQDHNEELMIETFAAIPEDMRGKYDAARKNEFMEGWARQRAQALKMRGVYTLICRDPSTLRTVVGDQTIQKAFTKENREQFTQIMLGAFRTKDFDKGLFDAVEYARKAFDENMGAGVKAQGTAPEAPAPTTPAGTGANGGDGGGSSADVPSPAPAPSGGTNFPGGVTVHRGSGLGGFGCIGIGLVVLAVFIVISIIRRITGMGRRYGPGGYGGPGYGGYGGGGGYGYPGGGGGGFGTGLLGGLLGGMLGGYAADRFQHRGDPSGGGGAMPPAGDAGGGTFHEPTGDQGESFLGGGSSGGDFGGGLGGGGDIGGGSSGGDFGGGGGGGGDFGGGGGGGSGSSGGDF